MKIEFFEPPMCCPTGLCGPSPDEKIVKLNENIKILEEKYSEIDIQRYMITQQPSKFKENEQVYKIIMENDKNVLPITVINGNIIKTHEYPDLEEIEKKLEE